MSSFTAASLQLLSSALLESISPPHPEQMHTNRLKKVLKDLEPRRGNLALSRP